MSSKTLAITLRAKKLGVLIRDARLSRNKDVEECARALGVSTETFEAYEYGDKSPSLPEVEMLAYYLGMPVDHFWGQVALSKGGGSKRKFDPQFLLGLRQRIVGVQIRRARLQAQRSLEDLAQDIGVTARQLEAYELGEMAIPLPQLDALVMRLSLSIRDFRDQKGPLAESFRRNQTAKGFDELSSDLQAFIGKPVNRPYVELAQHLSEMQTEKLRTIAEALLEITL